ncbi:hypothetical protein [Candidatus Uabimicrobium sp. HlEnr_7]|uniref:hypothetical protein n=1 Tax=Candidatus Uabimicrobium helgolandensis TaxID=3095367 RepID=UPI003557C542
MFKISVFIITLTILIPIFSEEIVVSTTGQTLEQAQEEAMRKVSAFSKDYTIVKKMYIAPPLLKNWQVNIILRSETHSAGIRVFTGRGSTKQEARSHAVMKAQRFHGDNFTVVRERYQGRLKVICRLTINLTRNAEMSQNRAWLFRGVDRVRNVARKKAFSKAITLLGKNIKIIKEKYRDAKVFFICSLLVERSKAMSVVDLSQGENWLITSGENYSLVQEKTTNLAKRLWGSKIAVRGSWASESKGVWHYGVYATASEVNENVLMIQELGKTEQNAYKNAIEKLEMATPLGENFTVVKISYDKLDDLSQCTLTTVSQRLYDSLERK